MGREEGRMSEHIVDTFGIVQEFADLHGDMTTPLYEAIMNVMLSRQREEIVRCCDCKHYDAEINGCDEFGDIWHDEYANVEPDGFCKWGRRRK